MDKKPEERDLRRHFEAILGYEIGEIEDSGVATRERKAVWSEDLDNGHVTSREVGTTGDSTKACGSVSILSIGGLTRTGGDGQSEILLSEYFCLPQSPSSSVGEAIHFDSPIIFVGTAQSHDPVFVTIHTSEVYDNGAITDIRVKIYTWQPNGAPAKGKLVKWLCRIPFTRSTQPVM